MTPQITDRAVLGTCTSWSSSAALLRLSWWAPKFMLAAASARAPMAANRGPVPSESLRLAVCGLHLRSAARCFITPSPSMCWDAWAHATQGTGTSLRGQRLPREC